MLHLVGFISLFRQNVVYKISCPFFFCKNKIRLPVGLLLDLSGLFRLLYKCASVGFDKLLFHKRNASVLTVPVNQNLLVFISD